MQGCVDDQKATCELLRHFASTYVEACNKCYDDSEYRNMRDEKGELGSGVRQGAEYWKDAPLVIGHRIHLVSEEHAEPKVENDVSHIA